MQTDMKDDAELRRLFTSCDCGQLFELTDDLNEILPRPKAEEARQYPGLGA